MKQTETQSLKVGDVVKVHQSVKGADGGLYGKFNIEKITPTMIVAYDHKTKETMKFNAKTLRGVGASDHLMIKEGETFGQRVANKIMGAAPKEPKYKVGQRVRYETSPGQKDWKDGGRGEGEITEYKNGHYMINGNPVNHFEIKGVVKEELITEAAHAVIKDLIGKFEKEADTLAHFYVKAPGARVWTRGDGSKYRDPGQIRGGYDDKLSAEQKKQLNAFWQFLQKQPSAKKMEISGEFGSSNFQKAISLKGLYFALTDWGSVEYGDASRLRNSSVWRKKDVKEAKEDEVAVKAQEYKDHLIKTLPNLMKTIGKTVDGWKPSEKQMLKAINTAYKALKANDDTSDWSSKVKEAGKILRDEINSLQEGYDTGENNREHFDDFAEWQREVRRAGGDVFAKGAADGKYTAQAWDGLCGEFDKSKKEGWLVAKWGKKPVKESESFLQTAIKMVPRGRLEEGITDSIKAGVKSVKRGLQGWGGVQGKPSEIVKRNKGYDDKTVKNLELKGKIFKDVDGEPDEHSPQALQNRVIDREMKKRGLRDMPANEDVTNSNPLSNRRKKNVTGITNDNALANRRVNADKHPMDDKELRKKYDAYVAASKKAGKPHISWGSWALNNAPKDTVKEGKGYNIDQDDLDTFTADEIKQIKNSHFPDTLRDNLKAQKIARDKQDRFNKLRGSNDGGESSMGSPVSYDSTGVTEAESTPHPQSWHDVDPKLGKMIDKMSQEEKVKKGLAHPSTLKKGKVEEAEPKFVAYDVHHMPDGVMVLVMGDGDNGQGDYYGINVVFGKPGTKPELVTSDDYADQEAAKYRSKIISVATKKLGNEELKHLGSLK